MPQVAIQAPKSGEMMCWIWKHAHTHLVNGDAALCGHRPERWIHQSSMANVTCWKCRELVGWEPLILKRGDYGYSAFLSYGPPHKQTASGSASATRGRTGE